MLPRLFMSHPHDDDDEEDEVDERTADPGAPAFAAEFVAASSAIVMRTIDDMRTFSAWACMCRWAWLWLCRLCTEWAC